jgi:hypothetical protein
MAEAMACGLLPHQMLDYTPRMLHAVFAGAGERYKRDQKTYAKWNWFNALWARQKKMPKLRDVFAQIEPSKPMSPAEMRTAVVSAFKALGGTVTRIKKGEPRPPKE